MAKQKKAAKKVATKKETILKAVKEQLSGLATLKTELGQKKFEKRIEKAAKKLVAGIKTEIKTVEKKVAKKAKAILPKKKAVKTPLKKAK